MNSPATFSPISDHQTTMFDRGAAILNVAILAIFTLLGEGKGCCSLRLHPGPLSSFVLSYFALNSIQDGGLFIKILKRVNFIYIYCY